MHLEVTQQNRFFGSIQSQGQHGRMERLMFEAEVQFLVVQINRLSVLACTIHDAGDTTGMTQAAARSGALAITLLGVNFDLHVTTPNYSF